MQRVKAELVYLRKWAGEYMIPSVRKKAEDVYTVKYRYVLRGKYHTRKYISNMFPKRHVILVRERAERFHPAKDESNLKRYKNPLVTGTVLVSLFILLLICYLALPYILKLLHV